MRASQPHLDLLIPHRPLDTSAQDLSDYAGVEVGFIGGRVVMPSGICYRLLGSTTAPTVKTVEMPEAGSLCDAVVREGSLIIASDAAARFPDSAWLREQQLSGCAATTLRDAGGRVLGVAGIASRAPLNTTPAALREMFALFAPRIVAQLELHADATRFSDLFEHAAHATLFVDFAGTIQRANRRAESLLGYSRTELLGHTVELLVADGIRELHLDHRAHYSPGQRAHTMGLGLKTLEVRRKDGRTVPAEIELATVRSELGPWVMVTIRDASERIAAQRQQEALEAQLRQTQKLEAMGTMASGIAHDFNNILMSITANLELLRGDLVTANVSSATLERIERATRRAGALIRRILTFGRKLPSKREPLALEAIVNEAGHLLRAAIPARIQIVVDVSPRLPPILADSTQILQVIMNLGTNAWHAMSGRGRLELHAHEVVFGDDDAARLGVRAGAYVDLTVTDTGSGMDETTLGRIFEPFFSTKQQGEGTGLGLAVVRGIVLEHGGAVNVESELGRGTTFHVMMPCAPATATRGHTTLAPATAPATAAPAGKTVLYVDDEVDLVTVGALGLKRLGYAVQACTWASEALELLRKDSTRFDAVITDVNMPEMSGLELAANVYQIDPELPVLLISGNRDDSQPVPPNVRGALDKPYGIGDLAEALRAALASH